ncbi:alpha/beta hydrolase [Chitinimonas lacunae]|uniref:Alpha/beta hydrolase n=1 Tax=Chitinimonas lacunae TaxID=1963018 RepID=A0ABV8MRR5_9NEIS
MLTDTFRAADGALSARYHWPAATPRRLVIIAHGMAEHAARYDRLAQALNQAGCSVWALDHRGHGRSVEDGRYGHFGVGWSQVVADLAQLCRDVRAAHPGLSLIVIGHSMGSFVARSLLLSHPALLDGLLLSATGFRQAPLARLMGRIAAWEARRRGSDRPNPLLRRLVFGTFNLRFLPARTSNDWLSRDAAEVDRYIADPLCGFDCSASLWQTLFDAIVALEAAEAAPPLALPPDLPVRLIAGSHDPVSMGGLGCRQLAARYRAAGLKRVDTLLYPNGRHELFNELPEQRELVTRDLIDWLQSIR